LPCGKPSQAKKYLREVKKAGQNSLKKGDAKAYWLAKKCGLANWHIFEILQKKAGTGKVASK
jgi:hypothetical protein